MKNQRFAFIDALRGLASLGVVLFHAVEGNHIGALPEPVRAVASFGGYGVPVFFVISGFVIAHSLRDQEMTAGRAFQFMAKRSVRLDPAYWAAIILTIGFSVLATRFVPGRQVEPFSAAQIAAHLTYMQGILGYSNINSVFWTLCLEVQFYITFAVLLLIDRKWAIPAAMLVSLFWCWHIAPDAQGWFLQLWYAFLLGVACQLAWRQPKFLPIAAAYAALIVGAAIWRHDSFAAAACVSAVLIFFAAAFGRLESLDWRWLQFLGAISYSLYLVHNPITGAAFRIGTRLLGDGAPAQAAVWFVSIMASIAAASLLWFVVERPSHFLSKRLFRRDQPITLPIAETA